MSHQAWFGSEDSYYVVAEAQQRVAELLKEGRAPSEGKNGMPVLWERVGDTALVHISGSLINGSAGYMRYYGVVGYDDLAQAALQAAADPDTSKMLFLVDSGGGQVAGLADFGRFLEKVSSVKPSGVYTSTKVGSAAYWVASSVKGPITMDATAEVGSIGAAMVHMDHSKRLEMMGMKPTVLRTGEQKMGGNPYEALAPEVKAHLEDQLNDLNGQFQAHVKSRRPGMTSTNLATVADGRMFLGKKAVAVGLADRIGSFEQALKLLDKNSSKKDTPYNSKGAIVAKYNLTDEQVTRLAAGATLADLGIVADDGADDAAKLAAAKKLAEDEAATKLAAEAEAAEKLRLEKLAGAQTDDKLTTYLQTQLDAKSTELVKAQADLASATASASAMKATHDGLMKIARQATTRMLVPMGGSPAQIEAMDAAGLIAKFEEVDKEFAAKFPVGGKSKGADPDKKAAAVDLPAGFKTLQERNATK